MIQLFSACTFPIEDHRKSLHDLLQQSILSAESALHMQHYFATVPSWRPP